MNSWRYASASHAVVFRVLEDGMQESCFITRQDVAEWMAQGNELLPPPVIETQPAA